MTAKSDIEAIKNDDSISDAERIWKALEKLAEHVDNAPAAGARQAAEDMSRMFRGA